MVLNLVVFQEPRGVMRILQFIFSICAFATTSGFTNQILLQYCDKQSPPVELSYSYPFELDGVSTQVNCRNATEKIYLVGDFSSDAQFFVATGVISMLYCIGITAVYIMFDEIYQANVALPKFDFLLTVLLAVFWLSGSAAWANGLTGLGAVTKYEAISSLNYCNNNACLGLSSESLSTLTISVIFGFLNFFLWTSDLWFLYKETQWFKDATQPANMPSLQSLCRPCTSCFTATDSQQ
jgi:hypothetical protein